MAVSPPPTTLGQQGSETYRLRVLNTLYGSVDVSLDAGETWLLVARVIKPAVDRAPGGSSDSAIVERSSAQGVAFGIGDKKILRLLPDSPANQRDPTAIVVNLSASGSLFKDLIPPVGSPVQQVSNRKSVPLAGDYTPQDGDQLLFVVHRAEAANAAKVPEYAREASQRYQDTAIARLRAAGKKPVSGYLTLNASPASGDTPNAITFLIDGAVVGILNRPPYVLRLDTRPWANGEHLVEVRGLTETGASYTQKRLLVIVDNRVP